MYIGIVQETTETERGTPNNPFEWASPCARAMIGTYF